MEPLLNPPSLPICLPDEELARLLREDVPYFDLTTFALGIGDMPGSIAFATRHPTVVCGTEEAGRLLELCGARLRTSARSGSLLAAGTVLLEAEGPAQALHRAWKVAVNLLEYVSGIATRTHEIVAAARQANPQITVASTRKVFPGTKALAVKGILAGGAVPHRLGLSETVLVFPQHLAFLGGLDGWLKVVESVKLSCREKKIGVEVENLEDALIVAQAGADMIQFDKLAPPELQRAVETLKPRYPALTLAAAGGINSANARSYAESGVDLLVTTAPYFAPPADIGATMRRG